MGQESSRPVLLLHGAGLGSWIWATVKPLLTIDAEAVDLPGRGPGARPNAVTLRDCVDYVEALLLSRDEPCVVVAHSFSAQVAVMAAVEHPERVRALLLVGAVLPESGKPLLSIFPQPGRFLLGTYIRLARRGVQLPKGMARAQYGTGLSQEQADSVVERLVPEARGLYLDPVEWRKPAAHIPVFYVKLLRDAAIPPAQQEQMARRAGASRIETIDAGHLPMVSHPMQMAEILNRTARQLT
ncbi:MAG TPA: alpha/beta hydrolase [Gemmatimonadaceae bacterium]|nr:alpha/beta hydrolase [Gemmatimonadaceae bacterium]